MNPEMVFKNHNYVTYATKHELSLLFKNKNHFDAIYT